MTLLWSSPLALIVQGRITRKALVRYGEADLEFR